MNVCARRLLQAVVFVPLAVLLQLLEPVVRSVLATAMVIGFVMAVVFELSAVGPKFPFLVVAAASVACGFVLIAFYWVASLVSE